MNDYDTWKTASPPEHRMVCPRCNRDAEDADERSVRPPVGSLERIDQYFPAIGIGDPFLVLAGFARFQHAPIMLYKKVCNFFIKEVVVGLSDNLLP